MSATLLGRYEVSLVEPREGSMAPRVGALLDSAFGYPAAHERGWTQMAPEFRVVALAGERVAGSCGVCRVAAEPAALLYGFADIAVAEGDRGLGLARALTERAVAGAVARGAELLLTATAALRGVFTGLGFEALAPGRCYYVRDGREQGHHPDWLARAEGAGRVPHRLRIEGPF